jgi:hypothetical protein
MCDAQSLIDSGFIKLRHVTQDTGPSSKVETPNPTDSSQFQVNSQESSSDEPFNDLPKQKAKKSTSTTREPSLKTWKSDISEKTSPITAKKSTKPVLNGDVHLNFGGRVQNLPDHWDEQPFNQSQIIPPTSEKRKMLLLSTIKNAVSQTQQVELESDKSTLLTSVTPQNIEEIDIA